LGEMRDVLHSGALLPLIPPAPLLPQGEKGELGVLMPETGDGTQGLPKKPAPGTFLTFPTQREVVVLYAADGRLAGSAIV
jgi:hypothetical protein